MNVEYNILSIVLGLVAWFLPIVRISLLERLKGNNTEILSILSLSTCGVALCLQFFENDRLVLIRDWSGLEDTVGVVSFASVVLLVVTIILNIIMFSVNKKQKNNNNS